MHFTYSGSHVKNLRDATSDHGAEQPSSYDAMFMNAGNAITLTAEEAIKLAIHIQGAGTPFFWLSTYDGVGSFSDWSLDQRTRFLASGARYIDIQSMVRGMEAWTRGVVEGIHDPHFCLPGPPNEIAVLLLKIIWAVYEDDKGT